MISFNRAPSSCFTEISILRVPFGILWYSAPPERLMSLPGVISASAVPTRITCRVAAEGTPMLNFKSLRLQSTEVEKSASVSQRASNHSPGGGSNSLKSLSLICCDEEERLVSTSLRTPAESDSARRCKGGTTLLHGGGHLAEASGNNGTHCRPTKKQATQQGSAQHRKCPARPLCHCRLHTQSHVRQMPATHRQQQRDILAAHTPRLTREQELRHPAHNQRHHKHRTTQTRLHIPRHRRHAPLTPEKYAKRQACTAKHSTQQSVTRQSVRHGFMLTYRATFYKVKRPRLPPPRSPDFNTAN